MNVCGVLLPNRALTDSDIIKYVCELKIHHFRGVFMRDNLPESPHQREVAVVNFNTSVERGSHWVAFHKDGDNRIYFDSFGQITLGEIQQYLKTDAELREGKQVIQRNTDIVQRINTNVCGHLCLYVLKALQTHTYQEVLNTLNDGFTRHDW